MIKQINFGSYSSSMARNNSAREQQRVRYIPDEQDEIQFREIEEIFRQRELKKIQESAKAHKKSRSRNHRNTSTPTSDTYVSKKNHNKANASKNIQKGIFKTFLGILTAVGIMGATPPRQTQAPIVEASNSGFTIESDDYGNDFGEDLTETVVIDKNTFYFSEPESTQVKVIEKAEELYGIRAEVSELETPTSTSSIEDIKSKEELKAQAHKAEVEAAIEEINQHPHISQMYWELATTINRMSKVIDNPIKTIDSIIENNGWGETLDTELVLAQIFCESSGFFYDKDGSINSSGGKYDGWLQVGAEAAHDMNKAHFKDNPRDRRSPMGNLELGICYDNWLYNYYKGNTRKALASYNAGFNDIKRSDSYGWKYAEKILEDYQIMLRNPNWTSMLLNGDFCEYVDEFNHN